MVCGMAITIAAMERNIKLLIAYDGTDFHGWQRQPGLRTVQGEIEEIARRVMRHPLVLRGSGRTDAGVHAQGQVANFHTSSLIPAINIRRAIGSRLPKDIAILDSCEVHPDFVSSASAISKMYRYRLYARRRRPVTFHEQRYTYHCWTPLDIERMKEASRHFIGKMDYSAMASAGCVRESMVREVLRCHVYRHLDEVRIEVEGTGFLYNQVRNMVGTLVEIGRGHWEPDRLKDILASRDRSQAGPTAPAEGLSLQWVRYPVHLLQPPAVAQDGNDTGDNQTSGNTE